VAAVQGAIDEFASAGGIDILVNNAIIPHSPPVSSQAAPLLEVTEETWAEVSTPGVLRASSCMFGGGDDLRTLYITTCSQDFGEISSAPLPEPAGALFSVRLPKEFPPGLPEPSFAA